MPEQPTAPRIRVFDHEDSAAVRGLLDQIDQQRTRAEAAEQEHDQLLKLLLAAARALGMLPGDRIDSIPAVASRLRAELDQWRATYGEKALRDGLAHHTELHTKLNATENDLRSQTRAVRELTAERDRARAELDCMTRARDVFALQVSQACSDRDAARDAAHRQFKANQAAREQHNAEWAHLRHFLAQYDDDVLIRIRDIRQALHDGPGLVDITDDTPPAPGLGSPRRAQEAWPPAAETACLWHHTYEKLRRPSGWVLWSDLPEADREALVETASKLYAFLERRWRREASRAEAELPAWVLTLVAGLVKYEDEHPKLYRHWGVDEVKPYPCPGSLLDLVPAEVRGTAGQVARCARNWPDDGCGVCWACRSTDPDDYFATVVRAALDWRTAVDVPQPGTPRADLAAAVDALLALPACADPTKAEG
ncbi:hypothetical protein [Micromonospora sp. CB01531]|uniref:hypothetical protein n=1 Tax=Micromonospora sp. CB01531 TaxID=1718947 RepID=UPI00093E1B15|nr:hypothetical protein [Micromonospora sp. CB01531]OKI47212.1 hypothetical protein A6A27_10195 [Micromonospora sp. CB01531]